MIDIIRVINKKAGRDDDYLIGKIHASYVC